RGLNFLICFLTLKFQETSVTRSLMCGKDFMGSTVMGRVRSSSSRRVMHMRRGLPLISAEQEPHLPALQFQRQASVGADSAWIWWMASRTTMPSVTMVEKSLKAADSRWPDQTRKVAGVPEMCFGGS